MRTDRTVMDRRAAVRTTLFQHFTAERAIPRPHGIRSGTVRTEKRPPVHGIGVIRRALRIRTKTLEDRRNRYRFDLQVLRRQIFYRHQFDIEQFRQFADDFVVELGDSAVFKHAKGRLLATDLGCNFCLAELRTLARVLYFTAEFWIQICHGRILWTF